VVEWNTTSAFWFIYTVSAAAAAATATATAAATFLALHLSQRGFLYTFLVAFHLPQR
jgi:hypothetical protein